MRITNVIAWLLTPALVVVSSQNSVTFTTSASPTNPTICGSIINNHRSVVDAAEAYDCLRSVPFNAAVASQLLEYLNQTIQFHSTLAYLANPPLGYQQPAVDLLGGLDEIKHDIEGGNFLSQYDFETTLQGLINAAHDDHLSIQGGILSTFVYGSPFDIVSLSEDGIQLPKLYLADELPIDGWSDIPWRPSAIASINGQDPVDYLTHFAALNSVGKLESHAEWNMLMRSGALDSQGLLEVFFGGVTSYPGDSITFTFENGTVLGPHVWQALYMGPQNTGPLETGGDFYNFFVLGLYPASFQETPQTPTSTIPASSASTPSAATTSYSKPIWDNAYPTPEPISQGNSADDGLPRFFFLNTSSVAVLSIPQFTAYGDGVSQFLETVKAFLLRSKEAGLKKLVIDVQQNTGGQPLLALEAFKLIFPSINPFAGSRRRAHQMADTMGDVITRYWQNLTEGDIDYQYLLADEWMIADRLDADTEQEYISWDDYFLSTNTYWGDSFTKVERYNLTDTGFMEAAAGINITSMAGSHNDQFYSAEDMIVLSDGLCSSACALFMELMHHEAQVRTVVVGGRPNYTPMQAPSGTRGATVYDISRMDIDIKGARAVDKSITSLPADRTHAFLISQASVNLRDQIRHDDPSSTPLQFQYEAADCRIFFTPATWYNFTNLWNYAVEAAWHNSTLCVAKSTTDSTQPSSSPTAYQVHANRSPRVSPQKRNGVGNYPQPRDTEKPSNEILDITNPVTSPEGNPCTKSCECSPKYQCKPVQACHQGVPTIQKQCVRSCSTIDGWFSSDCAFGRRCQIDSRTIHPSYFLNRKWQHATGYCIPGPQKCLKHAANSVFSSSANEDTDTFPCMANLHDAYLHCFQAAPCYQRCVSYKKGTKTLERMDRYCTNSQLKAWTSKPTMKEAEYDYTGSTVYWDGISNPIFIVLHNDEEYEFRDLFSSSDLAELTSPDDWPID